MGAVQFSAEPFNLTKSNSFKASGACVCIGRRRDGMGHPNERGINQVLMSNDRLAHPIPTRSCHLAWPTGLANSKALDIDVGAGGKLVLASKSKKALNKPAKLAHKSLLNKAPRYVPACQRACHCARLCVCEMTLKKK